MQRNISITDVKLPHDDDAAADGEDDDDDDDDDDRSTDFPPGVVSFEVLASLLGPAPERPTYNPLFFAWGLQAGMRRLIL
jgi:hypothetical protein